MQKVTIPVKIRQAAASDIPAMNELFQKDLGYAECTLGTVEKQFAGLDNSREAVFVAEANDDSGTLGCISEDSLSGTSDVSPDRTSDVSLGGTSDVFPDKRPSPIAGVIHVEKYNVLYFPTMANILGLAVAADFRRQGIGSALLKRAEEWARKNGAISMRLNSGESRKQAHEFYRAQGYTDDKKQLRFIKEL